MSVMPATTKSSSTIRSESSIKTSWSDAWSQAVSDYVRLVDLPASYQKQFSRAQSASDIVSIAIRSQQAKPIKNDFSAVAETVFIATVVSAGTHTTLIKDPPQLSPDMIPLTVNNQVATFLRYADAIDKAFESMANICMPAAFLFGAVRYMLAVAVKNIKLFLAIKEQFEDFNTRLLRLDIYLTIENPSEAIKSMLARVRINIIRFCGLATKYLKSREPLWLLLTVENAFRRSIKIKNQMEAVIRDLDKDTMIEIASGVAQVNYGVEQIRTSLAKQNISDPHPE